MTVAEVIEALQKVTAHYDDMPDKADCYVRGDYFRVGNIAIKIAELTEIELTEGA